MSIHPRWALRTKHTGHFIFTKSLYIALPMCSVSQSLHKLCLLARQSIDIWGLQLLWQKFDEVRAQAICLEVGWQTPFRDGERALYHRLEMCSSWTQAWRPATGSCTRTLLTSVSWSIAHTALTLLSQPFIAKLFPILCEDKFKP